MTTKLASKVTVAVCATVMALAVPVALAQDDYPSGRNIRQGQGLGPSHGYGSFDVNSGQKQTLTSLKSDHIHRICVTGDTINVIADGEKTYVIDSGDCIDIEASQIEVENASGGSEAVGTYESYPVSPRRRD